jgi:hypothetical protein
LSGIRTHDPNVPASEDISFLGPRGHVDLRWHTARQLYKLWTDDCTVTNAVHTTSSSFQNACANCVHSCANCSFPILLLIRLCYIASYRKFWLEFAYLTGHFKKQYQLSAYIIRVHETCCCMMHKITRVVYLKGESWYWDNKIGGYLTDKRDSTPDQTTKSRMNLEPTLAPIERVLKALISGIIWSERESHHSSPSNAEAQNT